MKTKTVEQLMEGYKQNHPEEYRRNIKTIEEIKDWTVSCQLKCENGKLIRFVIVEPPEGR